MTIRSKNTTITSRTMTLKSQITTMTSQTNYESASGKNVGDLRSFLLAL